MTIILADFIDCRVVLDAINIRTTRKVNVILPLSRVVCRFQPGKKHFSQLETSLEQSKRITAIQSLLCPSSWQPASVKSNISVMSTQCLEQQADSCS